ncbi:nucleoprotein TPR isoform X1 [Poecilia formosa]|uniref:nucleoprotein TPR isoform X1 n=1 Tax=Poecilia formosa TaxID=48698 RepID=UPI000443DF3B|nr:PREDICTED: nucleoprotein TPR isoform X1 [Poecilia formosa]
MAVVLLQALERTELNKLPKGVQNKLEKFVADLQNANEALKTQHERFKADSEQRYFDFEKQLTESQEQILSATNDLQILKEENKKLNEELSSLKGTEDETSEEKRPQQQTKAKYEIEAEKRELERLLEKRTQEVENLTEDMKRLNEKLTDTNKLKMELQLKLDEIQSSTASVQHREKRMEQEKELLEKKVDWLTAELSTKTEELLDTNREKGKEILELQGSLQSSNEQVSRLESQLTSLKELGESQSKRAEDLNNKLKQAKDEQVAMEEKYRVELNAHVKLSSLYKGAATDMEAKNQELSRAVEELSKLVKETGEANKGLEKKVSDAEEQKVRVEAELREKIKKMEKELENATTKAAGKNCCGSSLTEEQLDSMCPSAAAIAAIVKPGMKFFDLYNAYAECQTQLQLEKQETRRVSKVLDEIVQEVESKAPVLKRQREEYESMQRSMASLCNKLEQARTEIYRLQKEKDEAKQSYDAMEREKLKAERQLEDSSAQLCNLLVELEEARGNQVSKDDGSSSDISSTSEVNSSSQLSFRSVMELQRQNQSLLGRLRELEEEKSRERSREENARTTELESVVDKLQKEVEQLREQRNQQKQLADSNARQRDMFKALLSQSTGFSLPPQGQELVLRPSAPATRSTPQRAAAAESSQTAHTKAALKQLNDSFTLYKKEKAENDRMLNETNDRLQKQLGELRSSHAKLTSQLDFSNKRYEILQETVSAYRREISALQKSNQTMAATAQRHEHNIHTMVLDLRKASEKLALEQVRVENLTKERDMLRQAECRISKEKEAVLAEQRNQNLLLTNLKTIQLAMERTETETRQRLNNKIEQLEAELASIKAKLEEEVAQRHALGRTMDAQLLEAKKQLETQNILLQKTKELLRGSEQQVTALKAQLASASSSEAATASSITTTPIIRSAALRAPLRVHSPVPAASPQPSQSEQELSDLKAQLRSAEEQNAELAEQLKNANATVEQYRSVVLTLEDSLKKEKESRSPLEVRLKQSEDVQKQLEKKMLEVEKLKQQELEERKKAVDAVEKQVLELQRHLKASQTEQQDALERAAAAVTQEQKATQNSLLQTKLAGEAQAKYERELMLHAADVEALQQLKKTSQQEAARKREIEEELKKATSLLQVKTNVWSTVEKRLKEELSSMKSRFEELGKQNTLLHQEMDEMAARSRQQQQQQQQQQQLDLSFSEEGKTTEQILEILRFVRREKEIAVAQCEASEGEALRYKQQVEHKDRELKELQEALNAERERMQLTSKTLCEQQEQLKKMESISALQETNRMLKLDRDKLELELQQAQAKVTKLQSDIAPLHNSLSILSEKNGSLQADKRLLEDDLKRWKAKVQHLVSQQKEGDAEEKQKITAEKEAQQKRVAQLIEEAAKLRTELARSNASSNSAQAQLQGLKDSVVRLTSEKDSLKKDLETKNNEILEKNRTITQVKKIGRRYKTQYEELKAQNDKTAGETSGKDDLKKTQDEIQTLKEEAQKRQAEAQKFQQDLEAAQKEHQQSKEKLQELQTQLTQSQNELTQAQSQLTQAQTQLQQNQSQLALKQKVFDQLKNQLQQTQIKLKSVQSLAQARQNQMQQMQEELQQAKEAVQQNAAKEKELQQNHGQEVSNLKTSLSRAENKVAELQIRLDNLQKTISEREAEIMKLQEQLIEAKHAHEANQSALATQISQSTQSTQASDSTAAGDFSQTMHDELTKLKQELSESKNREDQLKLQMAEKEEKTKKAILGAKLKINQVNSAKEQLSQENEELKQSKEELEVRMNALKSQYEGRLLRMDRELRELRETQAHSDGREETQDQGGAKQSDQPRSSDQRQISLKSPAQDRGSLSTSEPPTANIRPTPSTQSPSNKPSPSTGSKSTPRASIRPMVTPAPVPIPTPTATVMPTTQTESQEALISTGASVHSTSSSLINPLASLTQPTSTQATAFVQPTQQQAANQDAGSGVEAECPSTSSSSSSCMPTTAKPGSKRSRETEEEEEESRPESSQTPPNTKKLRLKPTIALQMEGDEELEGELGDMGEQQVSPDDSRELPEEAFQAFSEEDEGVSQSVPSDQGSQGLPLIRDVIVIDTDSESRESKDGDQRVEEEDEDEEEDEEEAGVDQEDDDDDEEDDDGAADSGMRGGEEHNEESQEAEDEREEAAPSDGSNAEENASGAPSSSQRPADPSQSGEGTSWGADLGSARDYLHHPPACSSAHSPCSSSLMPRLSQPRRPSPRLFIQAPAPELGPPHTQRQPSQLRRPSSGRGPQLTPGLASMPFFDDDDRMVPSTPTLVVPHRTDGFAEAIHSPQVAGLSTRFRFGPPEDLLQQASASHSDLGQLASQGGLGMYESPLFLAAHDEDGGGRSVPTTPLQVAAPVTVFTENMPSDSGDNLASQSVPMVTASTGMAAAADDGDEVFMEQEGDGPDIDVSLDGQMVMESTGQQHDDASLPSTSQDPDTSSDSQPRSVTSQRQTGILSGRGRFLSRTGGLSRAGRGGAT